jgi:hypothetical protein
MNTTHVMGNSFIPSLYESFNEGGLVEEDAHDIVDCK